MQSRQAPANESVTPGFVVLYRWRLRADAEDAFVEAWSRMTMALRARGSLGSRLHRGADGLWYSYAQWPSARARDEAFARGPADPEALAQMRAAIAESLPEVVLEVVADQIGIAPTGVGAS
jgi:heme-degrading monooxygenase HmoA